MLGRERMWKQILFMEMQIVDRPNMLYTWYDRLTFYFLHRLAPQSMGPKGNKLSLRELVPAAIL